MKSRAQPKPTDAVTEYHLPLVAVGRYRERPVFIQGQWAGPSLSARPSNSAGWLGEGINGAALARGGGGRGCPLEW